MKHGYKMMLVAVFGVLLGILGTSAVHSQFGNPQAVDAYDALKHMGGDWGATHDPRSIAGRIYEGFLHPGDSALFDIRGWDCFTAFIGIPDIHPNERGVFSVWVDNQPVYQREFRTGDVAEYINIPLAGHHTLKLERKNANLICAEPTLGQGMIPPLSLDQVQRQNGELIQLCIDLRGAAQRSNNQEIANFITGRLFVMGVQLVDTPQGTFWMLKGQKLTPAPAR